MICLLDEQRNVTNVGGTQRLGRYDTRHERGEPRYRAYGRAKVSERHRHRYEFNNAYRERFALFGLNVTGTSPDGALVEVIELAGHPWFLAVQCHPEFQSKPNKAHPLFRDFVGAAVKLHAEKKANRALARSRHKNQTTKNTRKEFFSCVSSFEIFYFAETLKSSFLVSPALSVNLLPPSTGGSNRFGLTPSCQPLKVSSTPAGTFLITKWPLASVLTA